MLYIIVYTSVIPSVIYIFLHRISALAKKCTLASVHLHASIEKDDRSAREGEIFLSLEMCPGVPVVGIVFSQHVLQSKPHPF